MRFADPKNDLAFKKIFGNENKKEILISFLNAILDFKAGRIIKDVALANPYQIPKIPELKETILDIKATNADGNTFIVEMQKKYLSEFARRSLYYTAKAYVEQLDSNQDYSELKKVYFIGILDFTMFDNADCVSRHLIINQETGRQDIDDFEFTFIELPKFKKELQDLKTIFDKWIYFIQHAKELSMIPKAYDDLPVFKEAFKVAQQNCWSKKELEIYDYVALKAFDEIHALDTATKKGLKQGIEQGIVQGIERGIEQGKQQGIKQGREQGIEERTLEITKNLLNAGVDLNTIVQTTGLNLKQIQNLR